ncbi:MAG: hypothetical protein U1E76_19830 [Planctomycetota bacterium]
MPGRVIAVVLLRASLLAVLLLLAGTTHARAQERAAAPPAASGEPLGQEASPRADDARLSDEVLIPIRNQIIPTDVRTRVGDWWLSWFASELLQYDDNIFLEQRDTDSDLVSLTTAGATLARRGAELEVQLTAALSGEVFLHQGDENTWGGYLQGGARLGFGHGYVRLFDTLSRREAAIQFTDVQGSTVVAAGAVRTSQLINEGGVDLGYDWEKLGVEGKYQNSYWAYGRELDTLDAVGNAFTAIAKHYATAKLELNAQLEHRDVSFDQDVQNDFATNGVFAGMRWQASEKVALHGRVGYLIESSDQDGAVQDASDYHGGAGDATLSWKPSAKIETELGYVHDLYIAAGNNYQVVDLIRATVSWEFEPRWRLRGRVPVQLSHPSNSDDSTIWGVGLSLGWRPQPAIELLLCYDYQTRSSGEPVSDFTNNRVGVQASLQF